jgi:hypothetical protein
LIEEEDRQCHRSKPNPDSPNEFSNTISLTDVVVKARMVTLVSFEARNGDRSVLEGRPQVRGPKKMVTEIVSHKN